MADWPTVTATLAGGVVIVGVTAVTLMATVAGALLANPSLTLKEKLSDPT
jgi:hypothetical protein